MLYHDPDEGRSVKKYVADPENWTACKHFEIGEEFNQDEL